MTSKINKREDSFKKSTHATIQYIFKGGKVKKYKNFEHRIVFIYITLKKSQQRIT